MGEGALLLSSFICDMLSWLTPKILVMGVAMEIRISAERLWEICQAG
jgi:hypothetical protein